MAMPGRLILWPLSQLYGLAVAVRNKMFDLNILHSHSFGLPVICIGNITAGGTGKTPHVIYLADRLSPLMSVAVLSRGYLRKTRGFRMVHNTDTTSSTGDEPLLMALEMPKTGVFVDRDRVNGIREILRILPSTGAIILDDGFQHRSVKAGLNIVLTDWNRMMIHDRLLPLGMLRESLRGGLKRADIIIVTKTPAETTVAEREAIHKELVSFGSPEKIFFTTLSYDKPKALFNRVSQEISRSTSVLLVTGIADPSPLERHVKSIAMKVQHISFPDHHKFTDKDIGRITTAFDAIEGTDKIILTTSKDAVRLKEIANIADQVRQALHYLPVYVQFIENEQDFLSKILIYAGKDNQNR
jgi:tetraacyldisaccharide 4'-kinase